MCIDHAEMLISPNTPREYADQETQSTNIPASPDVLSAQKEPEIIVTTIPDGKASAKDVFAVLIIQIFPCSENFRQTILHQLTNNSALV